jgi:hypothetical protein
MGLFQPLQLREHVGPLQAKPDLAHGVAAQTQGRSGGLVGFGGRALQHGPHHLHLLAGDQPAFGLGVELAIVARWFWLVGVSQADVADRLLGHAKPAT